MALRVLIVDDDESVRRLLETALPLGEADVEVVGTASDGQEAIDQVRRLRPDLVVLDHIMPNRTGASIVAAMLDVDPMLQVILFSGFADAPVPGEDLRRVADAYRLPLVPKGNVRELDAAVARAARRRETRTGGGA